MFRTTLPVLMATAFAIPTVATASNSWELDTDKYNDEISSYAAELGNDTDRFNFVSYSYWKNFHYGEINKEDIEFTEDDANYIDYFKKCSNIAAVTNPFSTFEASVRYMSLGMSSLAVLSHNGVITPSDIQAGRENLIDIVKDKDVVSSLLSYQSRWKDIDFSLFTNWQLSSYTEKERIDMLLENAEKAQNDGKYFLIVLYQDPNNFHAMTGIGMLEGNYECNGETYDKCILLYDSGGRKPYQDEFEVQQPTNASACIYINSETGKSCLPLYYDDDEKISLISVYDDDFINYKGKFNPSSEYNTDVSDINRVTVKSTKPFDFTMTRKDGTEYDGKLTSDKILGAYEKGIYYCDGNKVNIRNTNKSDLLETTMMNIQSYTEAVFIGSVNNIIKEENKFSFDTKGKTNYKVHLALEEGSYAFTPHFNYEFEGVTDSDFSAEVTDRGIILSGNNGVKCRLKTNDVKRDENGELISVEDNTIEDSVDALGSILITFDEDNNLRYYIGENYDIEVQKGDVNCDGHLDVRDASAILSAYTTAYSDVSILLADYDSNGVIDARDASGVLTNYVSGRN